ncbi:hypothetical protein BDN72DRAFT_841777 [Pluteus cervinus]|uniref:Uncharacterized protein n=1 Tax=Pluteus cervinus TaxID=181527 RepID=A0ACD3AU64_9AGAR|nr:hypothetical protein BDN72DRAFT_841777 [Pluteus cervinus]
MESEDEDKPLDKLTWGQSLRMRIYDELEEKLTSYYCSARAGDSNYDWADPRTYRVYRLFRVIQGFHTGELDLTGRHERRYFSAMKRWSVYSEDVLALGRMLELLGIEDISALDPSDSLSKAWVKIQLKWFGTTNLFSFGAIIAETNSVLETIKYHPAPRFQRLTLIDLPPELLYEIFLNSATCEATRLIASCRTLRDIGLRIAFKTRALQLNMDWKKLPKPVFLPAVTNFIEDAGAALKSHVDFLQAHADLAQEITLMSLKDSWMEFNHDENCFDEDWYPTYQGHLIAYHHLFSRAVGIAQHLRILNASFMYLDATFVQNISSLPRLYTITIRSCTLADGAQTLLMQHSQSQTLTNLTLSFTHDTHLSMWYFLLICPNLRNLTILSLNYWLEGPPTHIWDKIAFLPSLRWLAMNFIPEHSLHGLLAWFMDQSPLQNLTRCKYTTKYSVSDTTILTLVDVLAAAPMETLALHGLSGSGLEILERITIRLPNLIGLTLHRRHNERQRRDVLADWPYPSATYAELFSRFTQLKHFNWNFRTGYFECSPAGLVDFEQGFITEEQELRDRWNGQDPTVYFDDDYVLALPFAAHCPTLQTFAVTLALLSTAIDRTESGVISLRRANPQEQKLMYDHCPFVWSNWGEVIPAGLPTSSP